MKHLYKKALSFTLLLGIIIPLVSPPSVSAQGFLCGVYDAASLFNSFIPAPLRGLAGKTHPWYNPGTCEFSNKVFGTIKNQIPDDEIYGERYTYAQVNWIIHSIQINLAPFFFGPNPLEFISGLLSDSSSPFDLMPFAQLGPFGVLGASTAQMLSKPPISGIDSVKSTLAKFDVASPANAQGYGYQNLNAVQSIWSASRNLSYLLMVILLVAAGFMVLFRVKINPQTAVTVQLLIPKILVTLLLVTFSFAIAGFVIDLIYALLALIINALGTSGLIPDPLTATATFSSSVGLTLVTAVYLLALLPIFFFPFFGSILSLVMIVVVLFLLFKVWWLLMKTYITLMAQIMFSPFLIMFGLLPGNSGFGGWFRSFIANASVFVVVPLMLLLGLVFWNPITIFLNALFSVPVVGGQVQTFITGTLGWTLPPGVGTLPNMPLILGNSFLFSLFIGYAVLALTPKVADMVKEALKAPAFKYGSAFGEAIGPIRSGWNKGWGGAQGYASSEAASFTGAMRQAGAGDDWRVRAVDVVRGVGLLKGKVGE